MNLPAALSNHPAAAQNLATWNEAAQGAFASSTQRAYRADSRAFADWCAGESIPPLPASAEAVAGFIRAQARAGCAVASIRRRVSTISRLHRAAGLPNPCGHELVRLALKAVARERGTDQRQAAGLTERDTLTIAARLGERLCDARNLALLLAGRDLLTRSAELVALQVQDLAVVDGGTLVCLRRKKTSNETGTYFMGPAATKAVFQWLTRAGITEGAVFQSVNKGGKATGRPLDTRDVRRILKTVAIAARLEHGASVSGHSLRVGMAQDLVAADMDLSSIMQAGGWTTPRMVARYTEKISAQRGAVARFYAGR